MLLWQLVLFYMKYIDKEMTRVLYKSRKILIVDGYNIINAWSKLKTISEEDLQTSREMLVNHVLEYSKIKGLEAYIIFDAYRVKNSEENIQKYHEITIVFTKENQTADSYIEKFISSLSKYDEIYVATSDYAEQQIALGKGCYRIPARELISDVSNAKEALRKKSSFKSKEYNSMNRLENKIDSSVLEKLEKIRRNK